MYDPTVRRQASVLYDRRSMRVIKARQSAKMREIADALSSAGFVGLDAQADILGIGRSTAWTILRGSHKSTGLSPAIIDRMLGVGVLPVSVRTKIVEYASEKAAGFYGHNQLQRRRFIAALRDKANTRVGLGSAAQMRSQPEKLDQDPGLNVLA
jgi:hypothetical protein